MHAITCPECYELANNAATREVKAVKHDCRDQGEVASQTEDRLLEVLKAVGARVDSAVGTFTNLSTFGRVEQSEVGHTPQIEHVGQIVSLQTSSWNSTGYHLGSDLYMRAILLS